MTFFETVHISEACANSWSDSAALQVAELLFAASPELYLLLGRSVEQLSGSIRRTGKVDPECDRTFIARHGAAVVGLVGVIGAERVRGAQMSAVRDAASSNRNRRQAILQSYAAYAADVQPLAFTGIYVSRVAVAPAHRGTGLASALIQAAIDTVGVARYGLHVRSDHPGVVTFYKTVGFELINSAQEFLYAAMLRQALDDAGRESPAS